MVFKDCLAWYALLFEEVFTPPGEVAVILGSINFCGKRIGANNVRLSDDFQYYLYITQTHCTASTSSTLTLILRRQKIK